MNGWAERVPRRGLPKVYRPFILDLLLPYMLNQQRAGTAKQSAGYFGAEEAGKMSPSAPRDPAWGTGGSRRLKRVMAWKWKPVKRYGKKSSAVSGENNMRKTIAFDDRETAETPEQAELKVSLVDRVFLWKGVIRRFLLYIARGGYVREGRT
ncbi:MAG: hypothetical protein LBG84_03400 [Treponema sp.]|nr:hypothetical protein [Treponema sp.]